MMRTRPALIIALLGAIAATALALAAAPREAVAQSRGGFFGGLFNMFGGSRDDRYPSTNAYAPSSRWDRPDRPLDVLPGGAESWGGYTPYCVRLCDGRYFPLPSTVAGSRANATRLCSAMCPAAKTAVFHGGSIDDARSGSVRYADLDKAYLYREQIVADCTCNGRDAFGLARVDLANDPTLRAGDIVANGNGLAVFRGWRDDNRKAAGAFTPIENSSSLSAEIRRKLAGARVSRD